MDARSYSENPNKSIFESKEIESFHKMSIELNNNNNGDQFVAFLKKKL